jgi:hypothetical protein
MLPGENFLQASCMVSFWTPDCGTISCLVAAGVTDGEEYGGQAPFFRIWCGIIFS